MEETLYECETFENLRLEQKRIQNYVFFECTFINCIFDECTLTGCSFTDCRFLHCSIISLRTEHSQMKYSEFVTCNLIGIHWKKLLPVRSIAEPVRQLKNCVLKYNSFIDMSLGKFDFSGNTIQESVFDHCKLTESCFDSCGLTATQFTRCDMRKADFRNAAGYQIELSSNQLKEARFSFPEVIHLLNGLDIKID